MKSFRVGVLGLLLLSAATAVFGMSVESDYMKDFDFSKLRTFAFKTDRAGNDRLSSNSIEAERIQNALTTQLQANGFSQVSQAPNFIVAFYSRTTPKTEIESTPGFGFGPGFGWGYGVPYYGRWRWGLGPDIWTYNYQQGRIMVDLIDPKTNMLVWRGVVMDTVSGIGQSDKQANEAAKDLVKRFIKDSKKANQEMAKEKR